MYQSAPFKFQVDIYKCVRSVSVALFFSSGTSMTRLLPTPSLTNIAVSVCVLFHATVASYAWLHHTLHLLFLWAKSLWMSSSSYVSRALWTVHRWYLFDPRLHQVKNFFNGKTPHSYPTPVTKSFCTTICSARVEHPKAILFYNPHSGTLIYMMSNVRA